MSLFFSGVFLRTRDVDGSQDEGFDSSPRSVLGWNLSAFAFHGPIGPVLAQAVVKTGTTRTGVGEGMPAFDCRPASRRPPGCLSPTPAGFDGGCAPPTRCTSSIADIPCSTLLFVQPLA